MKKIIPVLILISLGITAFAVTSEKGFFVDTTLNGLWELKDNNSAHTFTFQSNGKMTYAYKDNFMTMTSEGSYICANNYLILTLKDWEGVTIYQYEKKASSLVLKSYPYFDTIEEYKLVR